MDRSDFAQAYQKKTLKKKKRTGTGVFLNQFGTRAGKKKRSGEKKTMPIQKGG